MLRDKIPQLIVFALSLTLITACQIDVEDNSSQSESETPATDNSDSDTGSDDSSGSDSDSDSDDGSDSNTDDEGNIDSPDVDAGLPAVSVVDGQVVFGGTQASLAGYSLFWSNTGWGGENFYTTGVVNTVKEQLGGSIIRAAMGVDENGGYLHDLSNKGRVFTVVDAAIENDMYVIVDWHTHHGEDYKDQAIAFFKEVATKYGDTPNVIYEIYNEPLDVSWSDVLKPYAQDVIQEIRNIDPDNLIIMGTRNWSQRVDEAADNPITDFTNIAYTLHFYSGTHTQYLRDIAQQAVDKNLPLFVTEWGTVNADGNGDVNELETRRWMEFLEQNKISHVNWALNDKDEGSSLLLPGSNRNGVWDANSFSVSGHLVNDLVSSAEIKLSDL